MNQWYHYWPVWLAASYLLLLPFSRLAEIPVMLLALAAPVLLWQARHQAGLYKHLAPLLILFAALWIPMLLSSLDSYAPETSWQHTLAALRFLALAITLQLALQFHHMQQLLLTLLAAIVGFWVIDVLVQALSGINMFGFVADEHRLGGVFGDDVWFLGPTLAMLSPLLLEWAWRRAPNWLTACLFIALAMAVLLAGMRAGWLLLPLLAVFYAIRLLRHNGRRALGWLAYIAVITGLLITLSAYQSPIVQERINQTLQLSSTNADDLQFALTQRDGIWQTSLGMLKAHPLNGVGVRAFPQAYPDFAEPDDPQLLSYQGERGSRHAHNIWLETLTDCGLFGLLGLTLFCFYLTKLFLKTSAAARSNTLPYLLCLVLLLFPFNSHFSLYGTYLFSTVWWLTGIALATLLGKKY